MLLNQEHDRKLALVGRIFSDDKLQVLIYKRSLNSGLLKVLSAFPDSRQWTHEQWKKNAPDYEMNQRIQFTPQQYIPQEQRGHLLSYNASTHQLDYGEPMDIDNFSRRFRRFKPNKRKWAKEPRRFIN